jgi:hypothetical protein
MSLPSDIRDYLQQLVEHEPRERVEGYIFSLRNSIENTGWKYVDVPRWKQDIDACKRFLFYLDMLKIDPTFEPSHLIKTQGSYLAQAIQFDEDHEMLYRLRYE